MSKITKKNNVLSIRLNEEMSRRLEKISRESGLSKGHIVRVGLEWLLKRLEDSYEPRATTEDDILAEGSAPEASDH